MTSIGLNTYIWNNNLRSIALLVLYPILIGIVFWMICLVIGMGTVHTPLTHENGPEILAGFANRMVMEFWPLILTAVSLWFVIAWFFHTSMIRKMARSHPVTREEEPELYNLLENLCIAQGIPMPHLEIIETHARNAFASGISRKTYGVTITRGLMNALSRDELEAVLAHELTHIINRDVRLMIVTVIFTGLFGFLAQIAWRSLRHNLFYGRGRRDSKGNGIIIMMILVLILWIAYMMTLFLRFALSRKREFMADAGAVEMTKNPEGMMRALMRIAGRDQIPEGSNDIAMMCIENRAKFLGLFATHPPIDKRIKAISHITNTPVPDSSYLAPARPEERLVTPAQGTHRPNPWLMGEKRK